MLPKKKRLLTPQFLEILKKGQNIQGPFFSLKYKKSPENKASFSITVPKAVEKGAVARNALRRRGYAALQSIRPLPPISGTIFLRKGAKTLSFSESKAQLEDIFSRIRL